jgi:hypothetical protein
MDRREFIQDSLIVTGGLLLPASRGWASGTGNLHVSYIRETIPSFEIPPYAGERYEDEVPDTLDIADRARLGINCLTGITDPKADHEIFWSADFFRDPPVVGHDWSDWCQNVEGMMESLALLRLASGSDQNSNVDRVWMETLLKSIGPDGLVYVPLDGRPWARKGNCWVTPVWRANGTTTDLSDTSVKQITNPNLWPRAIAAMMIYQSRDRNPMWHQSIEKMIQGMSALVTDQGDYAFFPAGGYEPNKHFKGGGAAGEQEMPTGFLALDGGNVRVIQGLAKYYCATGHEPARDLAGKLVNFIRFHSDAFDPHGRFRFSAFEKSDAEWFVKYVRTHGGTLDLEQVKHQTFGGHFHSHTIGVLGILEYATAVNDRDTIDWCKASYEWAKTQGNSLIGFFPEFIVPGYPSCESCEVADMIGLAAKLTLAGVGDYWDDMDRWTRNQFAENQLTDAGWIDNIPSAQKKPVASNESSENVGSRNIGAFAGWASANEWALHNGIMHCCTGNSTRAIYYIWENIVHAKADELRVNLLLNRASAGADIYSYIPYQGRVQMKMKQAYPRIAIRMPEWVQNGSSDVTCTVNNSRHDSNWEGRYIRLGPVKPGDLIDVSFPIATRTSTETIGAGRYTLEIRGNTVVSVDPPGKLGAIYQRAAYKATDAPKRKVRRFVSDKEIAW